MTPIADMVEQMLAWGVTPDAIVLAIQTAERHAQQTIEVSATVHGLSADKMDERRERDRLRKQLSRELAKKNKGNAEANDAALPSSDVHGLSADTADKRCDLSLLTKEETTEKGSKERVVTRARGTRLSPDWQPNEADRQFARDHGVDVEKQRAEFVDYWIGVPGQRGTKLDWPATWRNRVRAVSKGPVTSPKLVDVSGFYADFASPQLVAWEAYERDGGTKYPRDKRGGWQFPTEWPPGYEKAA